MRRAALAVTVIVSVGVVTGLAFAGGGDSIASAPELPLGQQQFNARKGLDYWRLPMGGGDQLVVNYGRTDEDNVALCMLRPDVTDYTLANTTCAAIHALGGGGAFSDDPQRRRQFSFIANPGGAWTLAIGDAWDFAYGGCVNPDKKVDPTCDDDVAYELTAYLKRYTSIRLSAPATARTGRPVTLRGQLKGARAETIRIQRHLGSRWRPETVAKAKADGSFRVRVWLADRGTYRFRASYLGDDSHRAAVSPAVVTRAL